MLLGLDLVPGNGNGRQKFQLAAVGATEEEL